MAVETENQLFPPRRRVVYSRAPLVEVICQIQFPTILRIGASDPAEFQEQVRSEFPHFMVEHQVPPDIPPQVSELLGMQPGAKVYRFRSDDQAWTLSLSNDFVALGTTRYTRWEEFRAKLAGPLASLRNVYKPASFGRIGLRYVDAIVRAKLDLSDSTPWRDLLQPYIVGELSLHQVAETASDAHRRIAFADQVSGARILLNHGLRKVKVGEANHVGYVVDFDFFTTGKTSVNDAEEVLDGFNELAGRAFRWCITDALHAALKPQDVTK